MKYDFILKGEDEFYPLLNNKKYNVLKVDDLTKENYMISIIKTFIKNQNLYPNEKHYLGIDFEFNKVRKTERDVALMQINLENDNNNSHIFILYPPNMEINNYRVLIELVTHPNIIKILHGAESLDIPYLFNQLLEKSYNHINNFCKNFYDTKFICDYYNLINNNSQKCSIYNFLLNHKIINENKLLELEKIEETTGPIYLINIDIYNLDDNILKYSLYDVIYLPELIKKFIKISDIYAKTLPEITGLIYRYKRELELTELQNTINSMNIYYLFYENDKYYLKDVWEMYYYTFDNKLFNINYFKGFFEIITKLVVYHNFSKSFEIYKNKDTKYYNKLEQYFKKLKSYSQLYNIIQTFNQYVSNDIKTYSADIKKNNK